MPLLSCRRPIAASFHHRPAACIPPLLFRRVPPTSRLAQIVAWLQGGDDGQPPLVVFDEVSPEQAFPPSSSLSGPSLPQPNPCNAPPNLNLGPTCTPLNSSGLPSLLMLCSATRPRTCCPPLGRSRRRQPRRWWSCRWGGGLVPAAQRGATATTAAQPSSQLAPATTAAYTSDANASPSRPFLPTCAIVAALAAPPRPVRPAGAAAGRKDSVQLRYRRFRASQPGLHEPSGAVWFQGPIRDDRAAQQVSDTAIRPVQAGAGAWEGKGPAQPNMGGCLVLMC